MRFQTLTATLALLVATTACSPGDADTAPTADAPPVHASTVLIEGAHVFDGQDDLGVVSLLVEAGRITRIIGPGQVTDALAQDVTRVDYSGRYIIPGLVSDHAHVGNSHGTEHGDRFYTREHVVRNLRQFQAYGVTTVTALGLNGPQFPTIAAEVNADSALGAQLYGAGTGVGAPDGAPPVGGMGLENDVVARPDTPEAARAAVQAQAAAGIDLLKLWVDDLGGSAPQMAPAVYRAAIEEAHRHGVRVAAHIHDAAPAADLVDAGVDIIAHGIRDRAADPALIQAMVDAGTWYVPTININEANYYYAEHPERLDTPFLRNALQPALLARFNDPQWRQDTLDSDGTARDRAAVAMNLRNLQAMHEAGVRIGFGTDAGAMPQRVIGYAEHRELELMTEAGLDPHEALTIATREAAALLALDDRGLLQAGRRADFIVLAANPLEDIRNTRGIVAVWQGGTQVAGAIETFRAQE